METVMILEQAQRLVDLTEQLSEALMAAAICADDIRAILRAELDGRNPVQWKRSQNTKPRNPVPRRPLVDSSTFSVFWGGKTCPLRRTILVRLAERLARQPNQYITADQLLRDVWEGGIKSPETIRSAVRHLRQRLSGAGMKDLAAAIHGTGGRYGLILDGNLP
jgi:DNA-binding response OmpR family regulator